MEQLETIYRSILDNKELIASFIVTLLAIVKLTAWGRAKAEALDAVIGVIERLGANYVKSGVAVEEPKLKPQVKEALQHAVAKADPKKTPARPAVRFAREVLRGVIRSK